MWIIMMRSEVVCQKFHHTVLAKLAKFEQFNGSFRHLAQKYLKQVLNCTDACFEIVRIEPSQLHLLSDVWLILFL